MLNIYVCTPPPSPGRSDPLRPQMFYLITLNVSSSLYKFVDIVNWSGSELLHTSTCHAFALVFLKNCLTTFSLFCREASQGGCWWTAKSWIWLNHSKCHFSRSESSKKGKIWLLCYLLPIFFIFCTQLLGDVKRWISFNYLKGHFQGQKGQV